MKFWLLFVLIVSLFLVFGCTEDLVEPPVSLETEIVGYWQIESGNNFSPDCDLFMGFNSDGIGFMESIGFRGDFSYSLDGNKVSVTSEDGTNNFFISYDSKTGGLNFSSGGNIEIVLKRVIYEPVLMSEEELIGLWGNETGVLEFLENGEVSFIFYYGQQEQILNYEITKEGAFVTDGEKIIKIIEYGGNQITLVEINDELDCNPEFQVLKRIEEAVIPNKKEPTIELDGNFIKVTLNDKYYEQTCFNYSKLFFKKDGGWQRVTKPNSKGQYFLDDQFIGYGMCDVVMCVEARDISVPLKRYEYFGDINACPGSFTNQMCGRYPSYGLVDINGPVKIELDFYLGSDCKIPKHFEKEFERDFVSDEKGIPLCKNMGSKSEGWYDSVSGEFIEWDSCKNCQATCAELQVQPGTIVDKMNTWFNSCNINEIDFNNSCPMCVLEGEEYISLNTLDGPKCCPGLDTITGNTPSNDFCSQCGNHNCEPWENALSCGIDCDEVGG